jgi:two-component system, sporulation sensor kinase A
MNRFLPQGFNFSWRSLKPISRDSEVVEVIGIAADISKRKQYEQELKEAKDQLESFIQQSPDGIIVKELNGRIVKAIERILGWSETELTSSDFQNDHIPEDYVQELYELIEKMKQGDEVVGYETVRRRKDGVLIIIQLTLSTIKDHQGNIVRTSFVIRDITEIKKSLNLLHKRERVSAIGEIHGGLITEH